MASSSTGEKPRVLVLGGCGFIGRNLVHYLVSKDLAAKVFNAEMSTAQWKEFISALRPSSHSSYRPIDWISLEIRVADKTPPQMAWMNDKHKDITRSHHVPSHVEPVPDKEELKFIFKDKDQFWSCDHIVKETWWNRSEKEAIESVDFVSVNLINPGSVSKAFSDGDDSYDIVVNLAAETQYGRADVIYEEGIVTLSQNCAREAAARNVKKYIEISTGQVYSSDKKSSKEDSSKLSPWTGIAKCKLQVEEELKKVDGLNYCVLRPATVYGLGDKYGLTPRLIIGAVYRQLGEKMELLWSADLGMHTVHVDDVCQAIWHVAEKAENGQVFNVVDKSSTTQGSISDLVCQIFDIKYGFLGTALTKIAELSNRDIAEFCNDKHTEPWSEACKLDKIEHTPLSPYLDAELLYHKHMLLDGSKLDATGFTHLRPKLTKQALKEIVDDFVKIGVFPESLVPS